MNVGHNFSGNPSVRFTLKALGHHADLLERLSHHSAAEGVISAADFQSQCVACDYDDGATNKALLTLRDAGILSESATDGWYVLSPQVQTFLHALTNHHRLGLAAVLLARIEALNQNTLALHSATASNDLSLIRLQTQSLVSLLADISEQLRQDADAILDIVDKAKSAPGEIPLAERYQQVLQTFDDYIEPVAALIDIGQNGAFDPHLRSAEAQLTASRDHLLAIGGSRADLVNTSIAISEAAVIHSRGREVLRRARTYLMPLRDAARAHSRLSTALSAVRMSLRNGAPDEILKDQALPAWSVGVSPKFYAGRHVSSVMADAMSFTSSAQSFPDDSEFLAAHSPFPEGLTDDQLADTKQSVAAAAPIPDILGWLSEHRPQLPPASLLSAYAAVVSDQTFVLGNPTATPTQILVGNRSLSYHATPVVSVEATA